MATGLADPHDLPLHRLRRRQRGRHGRAASFADVGADDTSDGDRRRRRRRRHLRRGRRRRRERRDRPGCRRSQIRRSAGRADPRRRPGQRHGQAATRTPIGRCVAVDLSKIPPPETGTSALKVAPTDEIAPPGGGHGAFRTVCTFSHMSFDDPIVFPGQPGRSHLHTFFGNTGTNANSTPESIRDTGNSTCRGGIANRSSYWVPTLIDTRDNTPLKPDGSSPTTRPAQLAPRPRCSRCRPACAWSPVTLRHARPASRGLQLALEVHRRTEQRRTICTRRRSATATSARNSTRKCSSRNAGTASISTRPTTRAT